MEKNDAYKDAYKRGAEDAWEAAGKFWLSENSGGFGFTEIGELFGAGTFEEVFLRTSPLDAIEKIRQYEERKKDFQVGDEVKDDFEFRAVVVRTDVNKDESQMYLVFRDGSSGPKDKEDWTKTGRHFPQIAEVLKAIDENMGE